MKRLWALVAVLLIAVIIIAGALAWSKYSPSPPIEISLAPTPQLGGQIYVDGAVTNPGQYTLRAGDSIEEIIGDAGPTGNADLSQVRIYVPKWGESASPQKININRAEVWLLEALPGIGETKAQAIVSYRQQHGPFASITELTNVDGISIANYEQIKDLVTVTG